MPPENPFKSPQEEGGNSRQSEQLATAWTASGLFACIGILAVVYVVRSAPLAYVIFAAVASAVLGFVIGYRYAPDEK